MIQETIQTKHVHSKLNENGEYEVEFIVDIEIPVPPISDKEKIEQLEAKLELLLKSLK
jgi:hypothetical protein